jgi:hypothetical protein
LADPSLTTTENDARIAALPNPNRLPEVRLYSHTALIYWWPVWLVGYVMAAVTWLQGGTVRLDEARQSVYHLSSTPGLVFTAVLILVIVITNVRIRGVASLATIFGLAFITVLFAWFDWWDAILRQIPQLSIHLNLGFYLIFSTALLIVWLLGFFVFDRLVYWRVRPGQITEEHLIGGGEKSFDTRGMLFEQHSDDFFRHLVLGLGAGDLKLMTTGAKSVTIEIENVLFAQRKVSQIQRLVAVKPDEIMATRGR